MNAEGLGSGSSRFEPMKFRTPPMGRGGAFGNPAVWKGYAATAGWGESDNEPDSSNSRPAPLCEIGVRAGQNL